MYTFSITVFTRFLKLDLILPSVTKADFGKCFISVYLKFFAVAVAFCDISCAFLQKSEKS